MVIFFKKTMLQKIHSR